jgi:hypothetical protein
VRYLKVCTFLKKDDEIPDRCPFHNRVVHGMKSSFDSSSKGNRM